MGPLGPQRRCCRTGKAAAPPGVLIDVEELRQPANLLRISNSVIKSEMRDVFKPEAAFSLNKS